MEKPTRISTTAVSPTRLIRTRKKKSASACGAIRDASGGYSGKFCSHFSKNCQSTGLMWFIPLSVHPLRCCLHGRRGLLPRPDIFPEHHEHESAQKQQRYKPARLDDPRHNQIVRVGERVVVIAISEYVVHW